MASPEGMKIADTYLVGKYLSEGSFGKLHVGKHIKTGKEVAIKFESKDSKEPQLPLEYMFYKLLGTHKGIPQIYFFGPCGLYLSLVMEMLGDSLKRLHKICGHKFSLQTTARLTCSLLSTIEYIHNKNIIFRDIKPENFLMGRPHTDNEDDLYIIDFGLAKEFIDPTTGKHIAEKRGKTMLGTPRYMSVRSHEGWEQSRRDDLESIGYMAICFISNKLPWMGQKAQGQERYSSIGKIKKSTSIDMLCADIPNNKPFYEYMRYVKALEFDQKPDYELLRKCFCLLRGTDKSWSSVEYDWHRKVKKQANKT